VALHSYCSNGESRSRSSQPIRWKRTAAPTEEPVTLRQAKEHLGIAAGDDTHDDRLRLAIQAAREEWERDTDTATTEGEFRQVFEQFDQSLPLTVRPATAVEAITYIDTDGTEQTLSTSVYQLDEYNGTVRLKANQTWPATRQQFDAVRVDYTAGQSAALVRADIKQAMLLKVEHSFDALGGTVEGERATRAYEHMVGKHIWSTYP
jgi:uncharacterized phiE125 gp8 family phage protein